MGYADVLQTFSAQDREENDVVSVDKIPERRDKNGPKDRGCKGIFFQSGSFHDLTSAPSIKAQTLSETPFFKGLKLNLYLWVWGFLSRMSCLRI